MNSPRSVGSDWREDRRVWRPTRTSPSALAATGCAQRIRAVLAHLCADIAPRRSALAIGWVRVARGGRSVRASRRLPGVRGRFADASCGLKHACCVTTDAGSQFPPRLYRGVPYDYAAVAPPGTLLFTAGACPLDADGRVVAAGDHREQARVALANLLAVLSIHNCGPENLVRTTIYVVGERDDLARVWDAVAAGLAPSRPPSTLLGVVVLGYPDQLVEIAGVAAVA